jgi:hypothetical protein
MQSAIAMSQSRTVTRTIGSMKPDALNTHQKALQIHLDEAACGSSTESAVGSASAAESGGEGPIVLPNDDSANRSAQVPRGRARTIDGAARPPNGGLMDSVHLAGMPKAA